MTPPSRTCPAHKMELAAYRGAARATAAVTTQQTERKGTRDEMRRALRSYRLIMAETDRPSPFSEATRSPIPLNGSK